MMNKLFTGLGKQYFMAEFDGFCGLAALIRRDTKYISLLRKESTDLLREEYNKDVYE